MEGRFHEKEYGLIRAFVAGKGSVEVLGRKSMENMGSIDGIILHSHCLCFSVDKGSYFILSALKHTALKLFCLPWLPAYLMMIAGNGLTQNLCL